ncbi:MAG: DNA-binding protein YbiB, partial [Burkholderiaceae bacterium]|nr:DNA-binding protein YbiB [Burkholderiaceae bacterium]
FLDATQARLNRLGDNGAVTIVLPSYNGARKLPILTPLLALLLAREGLPVLIHGAATESSRVFVADVLALLDIAPWTAMQPLAAGQLGFAPTELLCPGLRRLLDVRRVVGLRNSAHSLVKLMNPCLGRSVVVGSYTHPEYARAMADTFERMQANALLLRGTEGEPVADARRMPRMEGFIAGRAAVLQEAQTGSLAVLPELPKDTSAASCVAYIRAVLAGLSAVPAPIVRQVEHILHLSRQP